MKLSTFNKIGHKEAIRLEANKNMPIFDLFSLEMKSKALNLQSTLTVHKDPTSTPVVLSLR